MTRRSATTATPPRKGVPAPGSIVAGFRVEREIAVRPGIDAVVEAIAPSGSRVALTLLDAQLGGDPERLRATLKLVRVRASLKHPHLLPLRGPRRGDGRAFYITPVPSSSTLADRLRSGPLAPSDALRVAAQIAGALELAASKGLVHHDLTPAAVGMKRGGPIHALLGDFGVTSPTGRGCELLAATGSIEYRSPEELRGAPARPRSSVYSLACILVEALTGAPPYRHDRPLMTLHAHLVEPPPRISEGSEQLPAAIDEVIAQGMAKDPADRFRSPSQLVEAAGRALGAGARVPVAADREKQAARDKVVVRERRRARRRKARRERSQARRGAFGSRRPGRERSQGKPDRRRALRPARISALAGLALCVSAVSGFAAGATDWTQEPQRAAPKRAQAPADGGAARAQQVAYVRSVGRTVDRLAQRRAKARLRLQGARRPAAQADAAQALARACRKARQALPQAPAGGFADVRLGAALLAAERAYRDLAAAARHGDAGAWRAARRAAVRGEDGIGEALSSLGAAHSRLARSASQRSVA